MKYETLAEYSNTKFRRITGVKRATFDRMVEILRKGYAKKHRRRGRKPKLSIEDMLLATLEYLREYRTYAHIAASYGLAESNIYRGIKWVEDTLIRDGTFSLPGQKAPLKSETEYEVVLVDATESPIERPKKSKSDTRACLKNVKTPNQRIFFRCAALKILEIRQDSCEFLPCPAKKSLAVGHSAIYQTSPVRERKSGTH